MDQTKTTSIYDALPKAAIERDEKFGISKKRKAGVTITEPPDFFDMVDELRLKTNWSEFGLDHVSFNQVIFFCVHKIYTEDTSLTFIK